ncbi:ISNCY family transposase [Bradyrhizobium sp. CSA112]|uniref:ISNCY family transposase n=1 Tax=Bradyrhizobium sp. CSA112 TaxID=2699170 RepID=UPI0023AF564B|nr:ISNCY family transposase [Bradyrhizobium sp. CSA112]
MIRNRALQTREKLVDKLPVTGELLRGSLLERTVRHKSGCPKCARGEGHQVHVLTVSHAGGRVRQFSVRRERVAEVRRWLDNYQKLKDAIEAICELNHHLLRPDAALPRGRKNEMRRAQLSFGDGLIAGEVSDLREGWMTHADRVLADEQIVGAVYEALARRHPKSRGRGRLGAPAEVVLRLLILKHVRTWSYHVLEREVRANLVYRDFTGWAAARRRTPRRWGAGAWLWIRKQSGRSTNGSCKSRSKGVTQGRRMRVDTTVVETNIHYPTDSTLLGDGVRVLIRIMKKVTKIVGTAGTKLRDRTRSVKLRLLDISRTARAKGPLNHEKLKQGYRRLLNSTSRVVGQAKRFSHEIATGVKRARGILKRLALQGLRQELETMMSLVRQVMQQTRERIFRGNTRAEDKLFSVFEPSTEIIRKGKAGKPNEFAKMVKLQEAENQIVIDYEVYDRRPSDSDLLIPAIEIHQAKLGRTPRLVAADAGFYSARNEAAAKASGVKRVCIPNRSIKSVARKREQKKRWFRNGQKWRTGCEGRISVANRRHGLDRCHYKGSTGMKRSVGLGVVADNLMSIGRVMEEQSLQR